MQAGDHAAGRPRGHVDPLRPTGVARHTEPLQIQRADTWMGPDAWTPDAPDAGCPLDRLDGHPTADRTGGQGNARPGRRPDILAPATTR